MLDLDATPAIHEDFHLSWEPAEKTHVLSYPDGVVRLSDPAAAILKQCDGETPVSGIIRSLEEEYDGTGISDDVRCFLGAALTHGWITLAGRPMTAE